MEPRGNQLIHRHSLSHGKHKLGNIQQSTRNDLGYEEQQCRTPDESKPTQDFSTLDGATLNEDEDLPLDHRNASGKTGALGRLRSIRHRKAAKAKKLLHLEDESDQNEVDELREGDPAVQTINSDPAFNPALLRIEGRAAHVSTTDKIQDKLQFVTKAAIHPKEAIKGRATRSAGQLTKAEHPYLSREADDELLAANLQLREAQESVNELDDERGATIASRQLLVDKLQARRESMKVAWTTARHVQRVRVVTKRHLKLPERSSFVLERDKSGKQTKFDWPRWLGNIVLYHTQDFSSQYVDDFDDLPFDTDTLRHHVERLVMASAPWQTWAVHVRKVYRWEDPTETAKWAATYLVLWYTQRIVTFIYGYAIYSVVRNRCFPPSADSLQQSIDRASNRAASSTQIGELIDKHGRDHWAEPLLNELGPYLQLQLGDMANILEVLSNFYHWKSPRKTKASLFLLSTMFLVGLLTDMAFCMSILWLIVGVAFFLCWPIASRYPKYRYLVSPIKWLLWDIPTDAEWSFQYLRQQAQMRREKIIGQKVEDDALSEPSNLSYQGHMYIPPVIAQASQPIGPENNNSGDEDWHSVSSGRCVLHDAQMLSLRCESNGTSGRLIVTASDVGFEQRARKQLLWSRTYQELVEMKKSNATTLARLVTSACELEMRFDDGETVNLRMGRERDEAFNTIVAFSGVQWQNLQLAPISERKDRTVSK